LKDLKKTIITGFKNCKSNFDNKALLKPKMLFKYTKVIAVIGTYLDNFKKSYRNLIDFFGW